MDAAQKAPKGLGAKFRAGLRRQFNSGSLQRAVRVPSLTAGPMIADAMQHRGFEDVEIRSRADEPLDCGRLAFDP